MHVCIGLHVQINKRKHNYIMVVQAYKCKNVFGNMLLYKVILIPIDKKRLRIIGDLSIFRGRAF